MIRGLYAIADRDYNPLPTLPALIEKFLLGGCKLIQLRIKNAAGEACDVAKQVVEMRKRFDFQFIINDYLDCALEVGADGVHVGANDMPVLEIRKRVRDDFIIGYSSHSIDEAMQAKEQGANYVALGAIYKTKTKGPGHPIAGIKTLKMLTSDMKIPVVAIGGINRENVLDVIDAGASAAAMITALSNAEDIENETRWFVNQIERRLSCQKKR